MIETNVPEALLRSVASDMRQVRALPAPSRRAMALVPLGVALLVGVPAFWGVRENVTELGTTLAWGVSSLQSLAGLIIVGFALRESVPGRELPRGRLAILLAGGAGVVVGITLWTHVLVPAAVPSGAGWRYFWECFGMAFGPGLLAVTVAAWMASRGLPGRPAVAGSLYGLGAGLMSDSGTRLFCWVSSPGHVLLAHGGVIGCLMLLGAATATFLERRRPLPLPSRARG